MNIFLISYGDFDYDGRLRELYKVFSQIGNLFSITRGSYPQGESHKIANVSYRKFINQAISYGKNVRNIDVLVLDNRKSVIPGLILKSIIKPKIVIQDCRELYIPSEVKHLAGKLGCYVEKMGIRHSDIIICANTERAHMMKDLFHLDTPPLVYENLRELDYSDNTAEERQQEKFSHLIHEDEIRIISSSGCSVSRTNDVLVKNLNKVTEKCRLFLVGQNTPEDRKVIDKIISDCDLKNVEILGQINQDELKYLISVSHIGIVNYHQKDMNNKFCASGKVYEFLYEGIPVVTTTNPPLKNMCDIAHIGISDDDYFNGINELMKNYDYYRNNVSLYARQNPVDQNNNRLQEQISELVSNLMVKG